MAVRISDGSIDELSFVFRRKDGHEWAPRNPEARALLTKGGVAETENQPQQPTFPGWLNRFISAFKGGNSADGASFGTNGTTDYDKVAGVIATLGNDLSWSFSIDNEATRKAAVTVCIDECLKSLDSIRVGDVAGKAGKEAEQAISDAVSAFATSGNKTQKKLATLLDSLRAAGVSIPSDAKLSNGDPSGDVAEDSAATKALTASKAGDVGNDGVPVNVDTAEHAKSRVVLHNKGSEEPSKAKAEESTMTNEEIAALVKEEAGTIAKAAAEAAVKATVAELKPLIEGATAKADTAATETADLAAKLAEANAALATAKAAEVTAKAAADEAKAAQEAAEAAGVAAARKSGQASGGGNATGESSLVRTMKALNRESGNGSVGSAFPKENDAHESAAQAVLDGRVPH